MCGICGKLDLLHNDVSETLLRSMCGSLSYRGPDDEGLFVSPPVGLGHRRLSIIDLSPSGHQPMSNEDGTVWLVFNGEIYDFKALRERLLSRGHTFKSQTDSETILHLYEDEGVDCLRRLNGMFAFALWDSRDQRLWLVRDRLGIKPLTYYWDGDRLLFASELKAILCDPDIPREIDPEALDLYLTLNYIPAPWTIFRNIRKLMPGCHLVLHKGKAVVETYWDLPDPDPVDTLASKRRPLDGPAGDPRSRLYHLLEDAVKRRLIADVPLGAFLSGGIDSSIIVALMAKNSARPVKTFSIGYRDLPSFDETKYARDVAGLYKTEHHEFKLGYRDILDAFPVVLENLDEPFADSSAVPTYIVSKQTRQHVTVALSGDGGDELFAGYRMYLGEHWAPYYAGIPALLRKRLIAPLINALPDARDKPGLELVRRMKKFIRGMSLDFPERFCGWREIFPFPLRRALLQTPPRDNLYLGLMRRMVRAQRARFPGDPVNLMLYMDVRGLLHGDMLTKVDRMSMVNALEVRVPFLDHTFVEYVFQLNGGLKLKGNKRKFILMETFKHLLPPSLHKRPKWGFEMPIGAWLRQELRFLVEDYLSDHAVRGQGLFDPAIIRGLADDHMKGRRDTSWHLWNLIVFQHWYRTYMP